MERTKLWQYSIHKRQGESLFSTMSTTEEEIIRRKMLDMTKAENKHPQVPQVPILFQWE
jgi:hypothetical protein